MPRQSSFVFCLSLSSLAETPEGKKKKKEKEKLGLYILFCFVYIFIGMDVVVVVRRRFLRPPGSLYSPPPFHFWVLFLKNSHGDPKRKQQKKEKDRRESGKRPDVLCFFLYFSYVYIDLCIAHTQVLRLPSNTMTQLEIDNFSVENKFFENSNFAL
jgi:hypothetical protein